MRSGFRWLLPLALLACESGTSPSAADDSADSADANDARDANDAADGDDSADATDGAADSSADGTPDGADGNDAADGVDATTAADGTDATDGGPARTFHEDIEPLLQRSCQFCHRPGAIAPFTLMTYAEAAPLATLMADTLAKREMPPWGLKTSDTCSPRLGFRDDLSLTDDEIAIFQAWAASGAKEGDPAKAPPPKDLTPIGLPRVDVSLEPETGYVTEGNRDEFVCFPLDPKFESDVFIQGVHVVPGNAVVAHHALVFTDPGRESLGLVNDQGWYPCFGSANVSNTQLIGVWAPGGLPNRLPDNAGMPISAGTMLVLQMHYHPVGDAAPDRTKVQIQLTEGEPEWLSITALIGNFDSAEGNGDGLLAGAADPGGNPKFVIPPGAKNHAESMRFTSPMMLGDSLNAEHRIYSVAPHMHYLGKNMDARVIRPPADKAFCAVADVSPMIGCLQKNCGAAEDVIACVGENCAAEYNAMPVLCSDCVTGFAMALGDAEEGFARCLAPHAWSTPEQLEDECLFESPEYDFQWQRLYVYDGELDELPVVRPGDVLSFGCTYDNSLENEAVASALQYMGLESPIDVELGETTLDEMCLLVVQTLYKPFTVAPK